MMVVLLVEWDRCFLDMYMYTYMFFILLVNYPLDFGWLGFLNGPCVGYGWSLSWNLRKILGLEHAHDGEWNLEITSERSILKLPPSEFRAHSKGYWELRFDLS